ncbi:hypothetical protein LAV84_23200 [Rhizobium sp. VS19-DR104.2]|uniref:hypothetical protein n=1 Tax=unclassified Rhizobium TaxID=2613769 RepID=UPI001C5B3820|nr:MULTISPECIES: hypothetical protein [unclassified Rhizobium]MBZ5762065.1 hypothetical protein [Rhizobium sp. VS19-DR96]MBZ5768178.1 hypothetical protein [Rhizobium sp. VS19-DR129.2]MBZ5775757.1 hypothetical protein [Rhizobium sp. VS19-DRK62.2]MBZ5786942.1 hypothetical protein [Rhizobium sp. VS19-DR121]MBZ5804103.1 hypothetical protein [Rhizobium sp. VS19-DR181]
MNTIGTDQLEPNRFYWARRLSVEGGSVAEPRDTEVVQVSTVFGATSEFWTVAVVGSDEHFDLAAYEFFHKVPSPHISEGRHPNSNVIYANSRRLVI